MGKSGLGKLVLIIGPSGVGKSVILQRLRERHPEFHFPRSATTRPRRPKEGNDLYQFLNDKQFDDILQEGKFLEWAKIHNGARYGTLVDEIIPQIEQGKTVVREVDVQGFESIRNHSLFKGNSAPYRLQTIFLLPESKEQLIERIRKRAPISADELFRRITSMERELTYAPLCSMQIANREGALDETVKTIEEFLKKH